MRPHDDALENRRDGGDDGREGVGDRSPPRGIVVQAQRDLRRVPEEERDHDARDQRQDQVGLAEVAAHKALRSHGLAYDECSQHAGQHEQREDVDQQRVPTLRAEPRQRRMRVDRADHRDDDRGEEDEEAPEDRRVHQPRQQPLQQLALADHDRRLHSHPCRHVVESRRGLAGADQAVEKERAASEQRDRDRDRQGEGDQRRFRISAAIAGTISFRSPVTV